jgi:hypothetical protein
MKNAEVDSINKKLADRYGTTLGGLPHFRIVWSNDLYETRIGSFNEFYGQIFLRTFVGAKKVRKYNYIHERWILEMWKAEQTLPSNELPNPDGFECIYLFEDKNGNPLPAIWKAVELICFVKLNPQMDSVQIAEAIEAAQMKIEQDDINYFEDLFRDNMSYELHKRHFGERISLA